MWHSQAFPDPDPDSDSARWFPVKVDEGVYMAFAGVSADGRVLASKIRLECQSYRYSMGAAPSMGYIARYVGECIRHTTRAVGRVCRRSGKWSVNTSMNWSEDRSRDRPGDRSGD